MQVKVKVPNSAGQMYEGTYYVVYIDNESQRVQVKRASAFAQHVFKFDDVEFIEAKDDT